MQTAHRIVVPSCCCCRCEVEPTKHKTLFTAESVDLRSSYCRVDTMSNNDGDIVVIEYEALLQDPGESDAANELLEKLTAAFSTDKSLGIVAIRGVPNFLGARDEFLPMAHSLAHLPHEYLEDKLSDPKTLYNAGWSHGKEKLGDKPDTAKGSFYFNPLSDKPGTPELRHQFPLSYPCNIWPDDEKIPGFESKAKNLGAIMHKAVVRLSLHIDALAKKRLGESYADNMLYNQMQATDKAKGRLLYYFPIESATKSNGSTSGSATQSASEDSWIGWHNDSGFLTALAGDMYVNDDTGEPIDKSLIDPAAGLYAVDRSGRTVRVNVPEDCMAVQIGECTQVITGGAVIATPHCVRGGGLKDDNNSVRVARISLPCFIDTGPTFTLCLPSGCSREKAIGSGVGSAKVPPLQDRWEQGMSFGDFLSTTFAMYYDWSKK